MSTLLARGQPDVLHVAVAAHDLQPALIAGADLEHERLRIDRAQHAGDLAFGRHDRDRIADVAREDLVGRVRAGHEALLADGHAARIGQAAQLHGRGIDRRRDAGDADFAAARDIDSRRSVIIAPVGACSRHTPSRRRRDACSCGGGVAHTVIDVCAHPPAPASGANAASASASQGATRVRPMPSSIDDGMAPVPADILVYSAVVAVATYPGTVSPLRGLDPFGEAERDVWQGRETERDELSRMVTADGFRAGLLFGEPGVGKTSLVRAGLIPHLRDHGIVALACEDLRPAGAELRARACRRSGSSRTRTRRRSRSSPARCRTRSRASSSCSSSMTSTSRATTSGSSASCPSCSRRSSAARPAARGSCSCARASGSTRSARSSGAPARCSRRRNRYELPRIPAAAASADLRSRAVAVGRRRGSRARGSGRARPRYTARACSPRISRSRRWRCAICASRRIAALQKLGGATELEAAWLHDACRATGNERSALRLCAELARRAAWPRTADAIIRRTNLDAGFAQPAFGVLESARRDRARRHAGHVVDAASRGADAAHSRARCTGACGGAARVRSARLEDPEQGRG